MRKMNFFEEMSNLIILNFLWIIFSLPIITIGASTTALYKELSKIKDDQWRANFKDYFNEFKNTFLKSLSITIILLIMLLINIFEFNFYMLNITKISNIFLLFSVINIIIFLIISQYVFLYLSYNNKEKISKIIIESIKMSLKNIFLTLLFLFYNLFMIYSFFYNNKIIMFMWGFYVLFGFSLQAKIKLYSKI